MAAGNRKRTSGVHFCQKRGLISLLNFRKFRQMFLLILTLFRMLKIAGRVILKTRNSSATTILLMSRTMKIRKLKLFYCQKNARYRAKELWRDIFLGNLSLNEGKNSVGLPVLILEFWWRHVQTKNSNFWTWLVYIWRPTICNSTELRRFNLFIYSDCDHFQVL